ncbi:MAG: hypothetical protein HUU18_03730 [Phycisphaerales bacterium]|nr:hypothetical protein [Phycisphaerales bacterium]
MDEQDRYRQWMLATAVAAVQEGTASLRQLVERCEGADPLMVRSAVTAHATQQLSLEWLAPPAVADGPVERHLPPPHPLDYEWRFSLRGAESILSRVRAAGARDLVFIGATTAAVAAARQVGWGRLVAFDRSRTILEAVNGLQLPLELVLADAFSHAPTVWHADAVVIDPPWYLEHTCAFLTAAARECRIGGLVLACLPGVGTRPGIHAERLELKRRVSPLGLEVLSVEAQSIAYETPLFEQNAFRAAGLRGDMRSWRRGDLWTFRKVRESASGETLHVEPGSAWEEMGVGRMRVRFLVTGQLSGDTRLLQICDGDVLPTVSRRDTRRERVRVWTSGNRVFACDDPGTLFAALAAATTGKDEVAAAEGRLGRVLTADEREWLAASCKRLGNLGVIEENEYTDLTEEDGSDEQVAA